MQKQRLELTEIDHSKLWYDERKMMSYNALFNFILGGRGTGKTYKFKSRAFNKDYETIWMRRTERDIERLRPKFMRDLVETGAVDCDKHDIDVGSDGVYVDGEIKIYFQALSTSESVKSNSFFNVNDIIYDEFIKERSTRYLPDEVEKFLGFYETVNRLRVDGRKEVRCYFLGNKASFVNPHFSFWGIKEFEGEFKTFHDGEILVQDYKNTYFEEVKKQTRFGKLISNTKVGKYIIENENMHDNLAMICKRPLDSKCICNIHYHNKYIGVWNGFDGIYCSNDYNLQLQTYCPLYRVDENELPMDNTLYPMTLLKMCYKKGILFYDDNVIKEYILDILQGGWKGV